MAIGKKRSAQATALKRPRKTGRNGKVKARAMMAAEMPSIPAAPAIQSPHNGFVPPATDVTVVVVTNRSDLRYKMRLSDTTAAPAVVLRTIDIPAPAPFVNFSGVFPGSLFVADRDYEIRVFVNPLDGQTPPHADDKVFLNTRSENAWPVLHCAGLTRCRAITGILSILTGRPSGPPAFVPEVVYGLSCSDSRRF